MEHPKVVIIGLDSATWDLIQPWAREGLLPNLSKLIESGVSGDLQSAIPPLTPPAWTSFMTGSNPGKHGISYLIFSSRSREATRCDTPMLDRAGRALFLDCSRMRDSLLVR